MVGRRLRRFCRRVRLNPNRLRRYFRKGLIESRLDQNGEVRWYITGKPYYKDASDYADDSEELLHYTEAS